MKINSLKLTNFRNHKSLSLEFDGKSTIIVGENGAGKTNILEAIHLISTTKSLRADFDKEMISHDENFTKIEAIVQTNGDIKALEMSITKSDKFENASSKKAKIEKVAKSLTNFAGTFSTVLFTPHDVELFTNSPANRRKYLDMIFYQIDRKYKKALSNYTKAIRQRNRLLEQIRDFGTGKDQIDFWTEKLIENGNYIQSRRGDFFEFIAGVLPQEIFVTYEKSEINKERLEKYAQAEIASAKTLVGPHRDDFNANYQGFDVAKYGSRGQKRTSILALKLSEVEFIENALKTRPVLLLDDIFSELDENNRKKVVDLIEKQQTIITTADEFDIFNGLEVIKL